MTRQYVVDYINESGVVENSARHEVTSSAQILAGSVLREARQYIGADMLDVNNIPGSDRLYLYDADAPHKGKTPNPHSPDLLGRIVHLYAEPTSE